VQKRIEKISALLASPVQPDLVLNRHCAECEFQTRCRKIAVEKDDLSLLAGMSAKERQKLRSKASSRSRNSRTRSGEKNAKACKESREAAHVALQALAIRENTVYIHGTPMLPQPRTHVYLDIEGLPDRDFHYLIAHSSFWIDKRRFTHSGPTPSDEPAIFAQFADTLAQLDDFRVFHFGDYDTAALKRIKPRCRRVNRNSSI